MSKQNSAKSRVLVVDDRADILISARFALEDHNFHVLEAESPTMARAMISEMASH